MNVLSECSTCHRVRVEAIRCEQDHTDEDRCFLCPCGGLWVGLGLVPKSVLVVMDEETVSLI